MNGHQLALIDQCDVCGQLQQRPHNVCRTALERWIRDDNLDYLEERAKHAGWRQAL